MQNAECRMQKHGRQASRITHHASRITFHVSRSTLLLFLSALAALLRPGPDEQADAGDDAVRAAAAGLLAAAAASPFAPSPLVPLPSGALLARKHRSSCWPSRPASSRFSCSAKGGAVSTGLTLGARIANALVSYVRYIGKMFWPRGPLDSLPAPGALAGVGGGGSAVVAAGRFRGRDLAGAETALPGGGLAVVLRHAGAGDRAGAGGHPVHGRPLYAICR